MIPTVPYIVVILGLIIFMAYQEARHSRERKDLYTRIMAGNLPDYEAHQVALEKHGKPPPDGERQHTRNFIRAGLSRSAQNRAAALRSLEGGD